MFLSEVRLSDQLAHQKKRDMTDWSHDSFQESMTYMFMFSDSCHARVMSHTCVSHVTDSYAWHVAFEWFVSRVSLWVVSHTYVCHVTWLIRTRAVTHLNDSVVFTSHTTDERELRYTYAWVMLRLFINHITHMNKDECVIYFFCSLVWSAAMPEKERHDWFITWLISTIYDTHVYWMSHVAHESCQTHA